MAISLPADLPANLKSIQPYLEMATDYESKDPCISYWCRLYVLKQGFILKRVEDDLSFLLVLMEVLGKNKQDLQSKLETTDIPVARAHLEDVVRKLLSWAENVPPLESLTNVVAKAFHSAGMLLDVCSIFGEPSKGEFEKKKCTDPPEDNIHTEFHSESTTKKANIQYQDIGKLYDGISGELQNDEKKKNESPLSTATDEGENLTQPRKVSKPERRKIYGRLFLLELRNHPASLKKPEELPSLEIIQNMIGRNKMIADEIFVVHHQQSQLKPNANTHCVDDISQKYDYGGPYVGGTEAGQVPPRLPVVSGRLGPTSPITKTKPQQVRVTPPTKTQPRESSGGSWQTYGYRQTPPYPPFPYPSFSMSTPAVFYQQQQPQPQQPQQQQPQQQQPQQTQQPQQPQQVPVAPPPTAQPRESSGGSWRERPNAVPLIGSNTTRDIIIDEEAPQSAVVSPTTATPSKLWHPVLLRRL